MMETTCLAQDRFRAEEEEGGRPVILLDQEHTTGPSILRHGHLRLDLAPGTTRRETEDLATRLNDRIHALVYVGEDPDAPGT